MDGITKSFKKFEAQDKKFMRDVEKAEHKFMGSASGLDKKLRHKASTKKTAKKIRKTQKTRKTRKTKK